jgi:hypothetical protein
LARSTSAFLQATFARRRPIPLMEVMANITCDATRRQARQRSRRARDTDGACGAGAHAAPRSRAKRSARVCDASSDAATPSLRRRSCVQARRRGTAAARAAASRSSGAGVAASRSACCSLRLPSPSAQLASAARRSAPSGDHPRWCSAHAECAGSPGRSRAPSWRRRAEKRAGRPFFGVVPITRQNPSLRGLTLLGALARRGALQIATPPRRACCACAARLQGACVLVPSQPPDAHRCGTQSSPSATQFFHRCLPRRHE